MNTPVSLLGYMHTFLSGIASFVCATSVNILVPFREPVYIGCLCFHGFGRPIMDLSWSSAICCIDCMRSKETSVVKTDIRTVKYEFTCRCFESRFFLVIILLCRPHPHTRTLTHRDQFSVACLSVFL